MEKNPETHGQGSFYCSQSHGLRWRQAPCGICALFGCSTASFSCAVVVSLRCVCCVLLFEIPGVSNARAVRFWVCFYVQIRITWHVRASSPAVCTDGIARSKTFLKPNRISHHPRKHTITPYNSSDAGLIATAAAAAAAGAHSESTSHILFSASQQREPSTDGCSACYR